MLIEFRTNSDARLTVFDSVARRLLSLMGAGDRIPGELQQDEVAAARRNLESALMFQKALPDEAGGTPRQSTSLCKQAARLVGFLKKAENKHEDVHWVAP